MIIDEQTDVPAPHASVPAQNPSPSRRQILSLLAGLGIGSAVFQRALAAQTEKASVLTPEMIQQAEWIAGLTLKEDDRKALINDMKQTLQSFQAIRGVKLANQVPLALAFNPAPWMAPSGEPTRGHVEPIGQAAPQRPAAGEDLAFLPVSSLAALIRTRQVSALELAKLALERLRKYDPVLH